MWQRLLSPFLHNLHFTFFSYYLNLFVFLLALVPDFFMFLCNTLFFSFAVVSCYWCLGETRSFCAFTFFPSCFLNSMLTEILVCGGPCTYLLNLYLFHFLLRSPIAFQRSNSSCSYLIYRKAITSCPITSIPVVLSSFLTSTRKVSFVVEDYLDFPPYTIMSSANKIYFFLYKYVYVYFFFFLSNCSS